MMDDSAKMDIREREGDIEEEFEVRSNNKNTKCYYIKYFNMLTVLLRKI